MRQTAVPRRTHIPQSLFQTDSREFPSIVARTNHNVNGLLNREFAPKKSDLGQRRLVDLKSRTRTGEIELREDRVINKTCIIAIEVGGEEGVIICIAILPSNR